METTSALSPAGGNVVRESGTRPAEDTGFPNSPRGSEKTPHPNGSVVDICDAVGFPSSSNSPPFLFGDPAAGGTLTPPTASGRLTQAKLIDSSHLLSRVTDSGPSCGPVRKQATTRAFWEEALRPWKCQPSF